MTIRDFWQKIPRGVGTNALVERKQEVGCHKASRDCGGCGYGGPWMINSGWTQR